MNQETILKLRDPKFYLENFTKIKSKKPGPLIPFILNESQKDLFNTIKHHDRVAVIKCRQLGISTGVSGYFYHNTITTPGTTTALIGYNSALTSELLERIKIFHETTPHELQPTMKYNSKYELSFPAMKSKIIVLPSTKNVGRGYSLGNCLATEVAFWDNAEEKMAALESCVHGKMVVESTPNVIGDTFHKIWTDSEDGYEKKEYGWWWGYTAEELELIKKRMNDPNRFAREMLLSFTSSGLNVFSFDTIEKNKSALLKVGQEVLYIDGSKFTVYEKDGLRIYKEPEKDHYISCGVDISEGKDGGSYSAATFWDRKTGEEVAHYRGKLPPERFGEKLNEWGRYYNNALMVVEMNVGISTMDTLKRLLYPSLYFRPTKLESMGTTTSDRLGWKTTKLTRPILMDDFGKALRDGDLIIHSKELIDEMTTFVYDKNGNMNHLPGFYDDVLFSAAIGIQGFKVMFAERPTQLDYEAILPKNFNY